MFPALFLESVWSRELIVNQFCQVVRGGMLIKARRFGEPLPIDVGQCNGSPPVFRTEVLVESGNVDGFAISGMVVFVNGVGRRNQHARTAWEEGRIINPLVIFFQKFFGVGLQMVNPRFKGKERGVIETMVMLFEVHQCLPCDLNVQFLCRHEALFQDVPVGGQCFVAIDGVPFRSGLQDADNSRVAMEDGNRRKWNNVVLGSWEMVKEPKER